MKQDTIKMMSRRIFPPHHHATISRTDSSFSSFSHFLCNFFSSTSSFNSVYLMYSGMKRFGKEFFSPLQLVSLFFCLSRLFSSSKRISLPEERFIRGFKYSSWVSFKSYFGTIHFPCPFASTQLTIHLYFMHSQ